MFKESPDLEKEDIDAALCFAAQRLVHPILARPVDHWPCWLAYDRIWMCSSRSAK